MPQEQPLFPVDTVILAGGLGTRLKSVISSRPKVLATVRGKPFLDILVEALVAQGFHRIILCVSYLREQIIRHFSNRTDAEFLFSKEDLPLGTGGAIKHAADLIRSDPFLVLNGDSFCPIDLRQLVAFHNSMAAELTIVLAPGHGRTDGGTIELTAGGKITNFLEKAPQAKPLINAGIYLLRRQTINSWMFPYPFSLEYDVFPKLVARGDCYGFEVQGSVVDIGTPERYANAQREL